jgi:hypothetical protein
VVQLHSRITKLLSARTVRTSGGALASCHVDQNRQPDGNPHAHNQNDRDHYVQHVDVIHLARRHLVIATILPGVVLVTFAHVVSPVCAVCQALPLHARPNRLAGVVQLAEMPAFVLVRAETSVSPRHVLAHALRPARTLTLLALVDVDFAQQTRITSSGAITVVSVYAVGTDASVLTGTFPGGGHTIVGVDLAELTLETSDALTERYFVCRVATAVVARSPQTKWSVAQGSLHTLRTETSKIVSRHFVRSSLAGGAFSARLIVARDQDGSFALLSGESFRTVALKSTDGVDASAPVSARIAQALVDVVFATATPPLNCRTNTENVSY